MDINVLIVVKCWLLIVKNCPKKLYKTIPQDHFHLQIGSKYLVAEEIVGRDEKNGD